MSKTAIVVLAAVCLVSAALGARITWGCVTDTPEWTSRTCHASVVFEDKLWLFGGTTPAWPDTCRSDVWCSDSSGATWTCICESAPWGPRSDFSATVHDETMWVMGGTHVPGGGDQLNDVWFSTDGVNWTCATESAGWSPRLGFAVTTFDGRMWVMGGYPATESRDVWYSEDGIDWTMACSSPAWPARFYPALAVHSDTMWLMGGLTGSQMLGDIWYSADGATWTRMVGQTHWGAREAHTAVSFDGCLWVIGGAGSPMSRRGDVWFSADGDTWVCDTDSAEWRPRGWHTAHVWRDAIWLIGGDSTWRSLAIGEVWKGTLTGIAEQGEEPACLPVFGPTVARGALMLTGTRPACLVDITGRRVADLSPGPNDIRHISPGIYFVHQPAADSRQQTAVRKVVVMR